MKKLLGLLLAIIILAALIDLFDPSIVYRDCPYRVRVEKNCYSPGYVYIKMQHGPGGGYAYYKERAKTNDHKLIDKCVAEAIKQIPIQKEKDKADRLRRKSFRRYRKEIKAKL